MIGVFYEDDSAKAPLGKKTDFGKSIGKMIVKLL